jgi:large conductance mechanosensitive channel
LPPRRAACIIPEKAAARRGPTDAIHSGRSHEQAEMSMAGMGQEFKAFVMRGNVLDLAIGVIIGAAFGKIVSSLVGDVLMPPIGVLFGGVDFSQLGWVLKPAVGDKQPAVVLGIGKFIQAIVDFLIIAFVIFLVVKAANRMKRAEPAPPPPGPSPTERLLSEIRDLLRQGR